MWSQCVWLKRMLAPMGTRAVSASPSGRAPVPQSKMKTCPAPVRTSTHAVLPPKRTVRGPGVGREPRVPQNRTSMSGERLQHGWPALRVHSAMRQPRRARAPPDDRRGADALPLVADGGAPPLEDVERDDEARLLRGGPHGLPHLVPHGHRRAPRDEHGAVQAEGGAVAELVRRELGVVVGETPEPVVATGLGAVELGDVLVVRVIDGGEQRVVRDAGVREEAARDADDPVDHLRLDAVALLVLPALDRIRRSCLLARGEARLGEDPTALAARHAGPVHAVRAEYG